MNEEKVDYFRGAIFEISLFVMFIAEILFFAQFELYQRIWLCGFILMLLVIVLVCDGLLRDKTAIGIHSLLFLFWMFALVFNV